MTHEDIRGIASFAQATPLPLTLALALTLTSAASPPYCAGDDNHNPHPHPNPEQDTVIAIKAPSGTTLEVPDPDEGMEYPQRRYQIYLKSQSGPVEVFLVSTVDGDDEGAVGSGGVPVMSGGADADGRRSSKRGRSADEEASAPSLTSGSGEGLLKLNPVNEAEHDYWSAAPPSEAMGMTDLFFSDAAEPIKAEG